MDWKESNLLRAKVFFIAVLFSMWDDFGATQLAITFERPGRFYFHKYQIEAYLLPLKSLTKFQFGKKIRDTFSIQSRASLSPKVTRPDPITDFAENWKS
jgi:hypothetical protein